ncbi:putative Zn-dependent hydrolase/oxidoreductase family protein [Apodospora peruviana]|uniref:Zn-dependent hydrolase/oxidoreductase family protein n=1 Tax=Apodospora peruviana TaxID=516989 RepID=A0AAE0I3U7_9PEZI|nr:putative Zn-dependent hydrolase/oxidoreductase family protein [Apodospora peruviana]
MATYFTTVIKRIYSDQVPKDFGSKPHHVLDSDGSLVKFRNTHPSWDPLHDSTSVFPILLKVVRLKLAGKLPSPDTSPSTVAVRKPSFLTDRPSSTKLRATWLAHSCYFVEFPSGLRVLFDPVFEDRCSPVSWFGQKRFTKQPCTIADIPVVDAVVISHSHYDHLSTPSVNDIQKHHPNAHFFVGLGLEKWFRRAGVTKVTELDWWEDAELTMTPAATAVVKGEEEHAPVPGGATVPAQQHTITARFSCFPAQHSSGRTGFDKDTTLWCSWGVSSGSSPSTRKSVFFGGDTGYRAVPESLSGKDDYAPEHQSLPRCPQFAQIGALRGHFDLGLIPIAGYKPRHIMSSVHANPFDAVEIFRDTNCRRAMGIHWGTWASTFEDVMEPPALLREALRRRGIPETGVFDVCDVGVSREF